MTLTCGNCGAPLKARAGQTVVTCSYCNQTTRVSPPEPHQRMAAAPSAGAGASAARIPIILLGGATVAIAGVIAMVVAQRGSGSSQAQARAEAVEARAESAAARARGRAESAEARARAESAAAQAGAAADRDRGSAGGVAGADRAGAKRRHGARHRAPAPTGPVLSKKQAQKLLAPQILSCMNKHRVHYLITRLGNERRGGSVPALHLTGTSVVDYKPTPGFAHTPLGRCVARAGRAVRAPAYSGNYIYFGLRENSVPDPLGDAPTHIDHAAANRALAARDDEARDCLHSHPKGSRPGESIHILVRFGGATGRVSSVHPYYVPPRSPYARCLASAYRNASVGKFKQIDATVMHDLAP